MSEKLVNNMANQFEKLIKQKRQGVKMTLKTIYGDRWELIEPGEAKILGLKVAYNVKNNSYENIRFSGKHGCTRMYQWRANWKK